MQPSTTVRARVQPRGQLRAATNNSQPFPKSQLQSFINSETILHFLLRKNTSKSKVKCQRSVQTLPNKLIIANEI